MTIKRIFFSLLVLFSVLTVKANAQFNKAAFYDAMATNDLAAVNNQLAIVRTASIAEKEAYEGALLMKKAGLVSKPKEKLGLFKAGRLKLEASIKSSSGNVEFNFLRLIIQEHAPRAIEYRKNLDGDIAIIRSNYKTLPTVVQQAIADYSKTSKLLKLL